LDLLISFILLEHQGHDKRIPAMRQAVVPQQHRPGGPSSTRQRQNCLSFLSAGLVAVLCIVVLSFASGKSVLAELIV